MRFAMLAVCLLGACGMEPEDDLIDLELAQYSANSLLPEAFNGVAGLTYRALNEVLKSSTTTKAMVNLPGGNGDKVLFYLVRCGLPAGAKLTVVDSTGQPHNYQGLLGTIPGWASRVPTDKERARELACMVAHLNYFGDPIPISVRSDFYTTSASERATMQYVEMATFAEEMIPEGGIIEYRLYIATGHHLELKCTGTPSMFAPYRVCDTGVCIGVYPIGSADAICGYNGDHYQNCTYRAQTFKEVVTVNDDGKIGSDCSGSGFGK